MMQRVGQYSETEHKHLDTKKHKAKNSKELSESFVCEWFIANKNEYTFSTELKLKHLYWPHVLLKYI